MNSSRIVSGLVIALAVATSRPAAAQKAAQPPELLVSVGIGPDNTLDSLRAFVNGIQPGVGAMVSSGMLRMQLSGMVTATSLDGLDDQGTMYVLAVDGGPAMKGAAVVGKIADEGQLKQGLGQAHIVKKNGWAVIGPKAVAEKVAPFALASLAGQAISGPPVATIYSANLMARYKTEIQDARKKLLSEMAASSGGQMSGMMQDYFDGMISGLAESDRVIVTFDLTKDVAAIDLALAPKAGSRLAKFVGAQQPADYALTTKLPATQAVALIAGRLDGGPYRAGLIDMTTRLYGPGSAGGLATAFGAIFKATTGEFAMNMQLTPTKGLELTQLFGLADAKGADQAISQALDFFKKPQTVTMTGTKTTYAANPKPLTYDGVTLRGLDTTYDASGAPPETKAVMQKLYPKASMTARVGVFDKLGVMAMSSDGAAATAAIDSARGKGKAYAPPAQIADFLAGSRARKESVAVAVDVGPFLPQATTGRVFFMSMGFADKRAHLRLALPAKTLRSFAGMP